MSWTADNYLAHFGILGQRWGHKNGPPYPLGYSDHSAAEKKANPKGRIGGGSDGGSPRKQKASKDSSKAIAGAVGAAAGIGMAGLIAANAKKHMQPKDINTVAEKNREFAIRQQYAKNHPSEAEVAQKALNSSKESLNNFSKMISDHAKDRPTYERMDLTDMTNDDLQKAITRENLEINYSKLFNKKEQLTSGEKKVKDILDSVGAIIGVTGTALAIALTIKQLTEKTAKTTGKVVAGAVT